MQKLISMGFLIITALFGQAKFPDTCPNGAGLPFKDIQVSHPIDKSCPSKEGDPSAPDRSHLQNAVKNNFCASMDAPETFTPQMLIDLQAKAVDRGISSGHNQEPDNRSVLHDLGEGKVVRMKAYLIEAHHADLGSGESVNCKKPTEEDNDIHVAFGATPNTQECGSVSAEITPHYRPASWNEIGHFETKKGNKYVPNPAYVSRLQAHPYRITGQLFFDASHQPCACGTASCSGNPLRASVWEIHPVYQIEVCKHASQCREENDSDWTSFDEWWNNLTPIQPAMPPHTHQPHEKKK